MPTQDRARDKRWLELNACSTEDRGSIKGSLGSLPPHVHPRDLAKIFPWVHVHMATTDGSGGLGSEQVSYVILIFITYEVRVEGNIQPTSSSKGLAWIWTWATESIRSTESGKPASLWIYINLIYIPTDKDAESVLDFVENSARVLCWHPHGYRMTLFPIPKTINTREPFTTETLASEELRWKEYTTIVGSQPGLHNEVGEGAGEMARWEKCFPHSMRTWLRSSKGAESGVQQLTSTSSVLMQQGRI